MKAFLYHQCPFSQIHPYDVCCLCTYQQKPFFHCRELSLNCSYFPGNCQ